MLRLFLSTTFLHFSFTLLVGVGVVCQINCRINLMDYYPQTVARQILVVNGTSQIQYVDAFTI